MGNLLNLLKKEKTKDNLFVLDANEKRRHNRQFMYIRELNKTAHSAKSFSEKFNIQESSSKYRLRELEERGFIVAFYLADTKEVVFLGKVKAKHEGLILAYDIPQEEACKKGIENKEGG